MRLTETTEAPEGLADELRADVRDITVKYVSAYSDDGELLCVVGVMLTNLMASEAWLWAWLAPRKFSRKELREGFNLGMDYLANMPWTPCAETAEDSLAGPKFLEFFGFEELTRLNNRIIYTW